MSDQKLLKEGDGEKKGYSNYIIVAVILIVLLIIFFGGRDNLTTNPEEGGGGTTTEETNNETGNTGSTGGNMEEEEGTMLLENTSFTVLDQAAGFDVKISSLSVPQPLWVVVYEDANGERGNILGARRVHPTDTNATVKLLRETEPEKTYYVVLHKDDGDETFDFKTTDIPFVEAGSEVVKTFNTVASN